MTQMLIENKKKHSKKKKPNKKGKKLNAISEKKTTTWQTKNSKGKKKSKQNGCLVLIKHYSQSFNIGWVVLLLSPAKSNVQGETHI